MVVDGRRVVEDEMHFMLECPLYYEDRKSLFISETVGGAEKKMSDPMPQICRAC